MDRQDDDQKRVDTLAEAGQELDRANAELSGNLSGYLGTRLPEDHDGKSGSREKKAKRDREALSKLERLLAENPVYADLYNKTNDTLRNAEAATEAALAAAHKAYGKAKSDFDEMMERANSLPDGTRVFRNRVTDDVYDEHGNQVTGDDLASIVWKGGAPDYNDYRSAKSAVEAADKRIDELRAFQEKLGGYRNRLEDENNPLKADELQDMQGDISASQEALALENKDIAHNAPPPVSPFVEMPPLGN